MSDNFSLGQDWVDRVTSDEECSPDTIGPRLNDCGRACFVIGGPFIAEDPACPVHGVDKVVCEVCGYPITECDTLEGRDGIICDECYDHDQYEYDGQPDEMQEWHDFDPDC